MRRVVRVAEHIDRTYPLVTVVIPTRNRRALLSEAIESVRRQTYPNWELIVVDDCSEDDTWRWLTSLSDGRVQPFRMEYPSERSHARNKGLTEAKGQFVLFLDDDDLLDPRAIETLLQGLVRAPWADVSIGYVQPFGDGLQELGWFAWVSKGWVGPLYQHFDALDWAITGRMLWRKSILDGMTFDPELVPCEDLDLILRLLEIHPNLCAVFLPQVVLWHRVHAFQSRWQMPENKFWAQSARIVRKKWESIRSAHAEWAHLYSASLLLHEARRLAFMSCRTGAVSHLFKALKLDRRLIQLPIWRKLVVRVALDIALPSCVRSLLALTVKRMRAVAGNVRAKKVKGSCHKG